MLILLRILERAGGYRPALYLKIENLALLIHCYCHCDPFCDFSGGSPVSPDIRSAPLRWLPVPTRSSLRAFQPKPVQKHIRKVAHQRP